MSSVNPSMPKFVVKTALYPIGKTIRNKTGYDVISVAPYKKAKYIKIPAFFMVSFDDKVALPKKVEKMYKAYGSCNKKLRYFKGEHHDCRDGEVIKDGIDFLRMLECRRLGKKMQPSIKDARNRDLRDLGRDAGRPLHKKPISQTISHIGHIDHSPKSQDWRKVKSPEPYDLSTGLKKNTENNNKIDSKKNYSNFSNKNFLDKNEFEDKFHIANKLSLSSRNRDNINNMDYRYGGSNRDNRNNRNNGKMQKSPRDERKLPERKLRLGSRGNNSAQKNYGSGRGRNEGNRLPQGYNNSYEGDKNLLNMGIGADVQKNQNSWYDTRIRANTHQPPQYNNQTDRIRLRSEKPRLIFDQEEDKREKNENEKKTQIFNKNSKVNFNQNDPMLKDVEDDIFPSWESMFEGNIDIKNKMKTVNSEGIAGRLSAKNFGKKKK